MKTFFKLIRWKNIIIVAITMLAMKYAVMQPIYTYFNIYPALSQIGFLFLILSIILLISGGHVINNYFDRRSDMINRPEEVLVVFEIRRRQAILIHLMLSLFGIICGFIASYQIGKPWFGLFFILATIIILLYSAKFKKKAFWGDGIAALLTASIPLSVGIFEHYAFLNKTILSVKYSEINEFVSYIILGFSTFAFLYSLVLGITKDCVNLKGDKETEIKTIVVKIGKKNTNYLLGGLSILITALVIIVIHILLPKTFFLKNDNISIWYLYIFIVLPTLIFSIISFDGTSKKKYISLIWLLKAIMLFGILYSLIFSFVIYGFIQ